MLSGLSAGVELPLTVAERTDSSWFSPRSCHIPGDYQPFLCQPGPLGSPRFSPSLLTPRERPPETRACLCPQIRTACVQARGESRAGGGTEGSAAWDKLGAKKREDRQGELETWGGVSGRAGEGTELREGVHSGPAGGCNAGAVQVTPRVPCLRWPRPSPRGALGHRPLGKGL